MTHETKGILLTAAMASRTRCPDSAGPNSLALALTAAGFVLPLAAWANPIGLQVVQGSAQTLQQGPLLQVNVSHNAFLTWRSFNIGAGETTVFQQPSASSVVWNRIDDASPSQIFGSIKANGMVVLANQSGFYFGPDAFVSAGGFVATTAPIAPGMSAIPGLLFAGAPPSIPIVNHGRIETAEGGALFLIARKIENHGTLEAPGGTAGLVAGQEVLISDRPDGLGLNVRVTLPDGAVDNQGRVVADAGRVLMHAGDVIQGGVAQANSVRQRNGVIELFAANRLELQPNAIVQARGDASGTPSGGGSVTLKSGVVFKDAASSEVSVAGGSGGGDGGHVAVSAPRMSLASHLDAGAIPGWIPGELFIDPTDIVLSSSGGGSAGGGVVQHEDPPDTLELDVNSAFRDFSHVRLEATHNITLKAGTLWDLPLSTGQDRGESFLSLEAGNDIRLEAGSQLLGGSHWSVSLTAGADWQTSGQAIAGVGNINLAGSALIQTGGGDISLTAGDGVSIASGGVRTVGGGSIAIQALAGSVDCGSNPNGFVFDNRGYRPHEALGGISTAAGGDVVIHAGQNIRSFLPPATGAGATTDAGTGAFGSESGNVFLEAGGTVSGHFVVRNGQGTLRAGANAGTSSRALALSLVKGGWDVEAGTSIVLQEVRNPNGMFNGSAGTSGQRFRFDYAADASVSLRAGVGIALTGIALPRASQATPMSPIYPPHLNLQAGSGGVSLGSSLSLFPSASGSLNLTTADGGDVRSTIPGQPRSIVVSDSNKQQWGTVGDFASSDRGNNLLHLGDPEPVRITVSGSLSDINVVAPKPAEVQVDGDVRNSSVLAQHLSTADRTDIRVRGAIVNRSFYTLQELPERSAAPDFDLFGMAVLDMTGQPDTVVRELLGRFSYNAPARTLAFTGRMTRAERDALLQMQVQVEPGQPLRQLTFVDTAVIQQLYERSQDVPLVPVPGIEVWGPGTLAIRAGTIDLGVSAGILSRGIAVNPALIPLTPLGADVDITVAGDLDMFSSTILSQQGGKVRVTSGGSIRVGSRNLIGSSEYPRGIVSLWGGDIEIVALQDVLVNGSRIAAYDGGNIAITSLEGNVDAGQGGSGYVRVSKPYVDPVDGRLRESGATIPGSGVLATSFPGEVPGQGEVRVGNIVVRTPKGDIVAGSGGFVQLDLHGGASKDSKITLVAGSKDTAGHSTYEGSILASGSGVIGSKVDLDATGEITGLVVAQGDLEVRALQNVTVTAIGQGTVSVKSDSGTVSGTIVGVGGATVAGANINANIVTGPGQANVSGNVTGAGNSQAGPAASTASQKTTEEVQTTVASAAESSQITDEELEKRKRAASFRRLGRVTILLPAA